MEPTLTDAEMSTTSSGPTGKPAKWHEGTRDIIKMRIEFPSDTNADLAKRLGVSREWVRYVLNRANLSTRAQPRYCELVCAGCGIVFRKKQAEVERKRAKGQVRFYHDAECSVKYFRPRVEDGPKRKWNYELVYKLRIEKNWGCVRIARELGIPKPTVERILRKGNLAHRRQKVDHEAIHELRREKNWGCVRISRELGIPITTVSYHLKKEDRLTRT